MLKIRFKSNKHNAVWLVEPKVSIGSASDNDFVVDDPSIAANHVDIEVKHESLKLVNVSGNMQVSINGKLVEDAAELKAGDELTLGTVQLEIVDPKLEQRPAPKPKAEATNEVGASGWALKSNHTALSNRVFPIKTETVIGRSNDCDITLAAAHLSRRHVKLSIQDDLLYVKDLGSANGTYLNGKRVVGEERVRRGDELRFDTLSFGVIGPSQDMDKTTVRPVPTIKPSNPGASKPSSASSGQVGGSKPTRATSNAAAKQSSSSTTVTNDSESKGSMMWVVGIVLVVAVGIGVAFLTGVF